MTPKTCLAFFVSMLISAAIFGSGDGERRKAVFSMYCYWTGEATLGRLDGVSATRIGHLAGNEIVEAEFDPQRVSLEQMVSALKSQSSFYALLVGDSKQAPPVSGVLTADEIRRVDGRPDFIDPKHSLKVKRPDLYYLDLSEQQAIALNSWAFFGGAQPQVLRNDQKSRLRRLQSRLAEGAKPPSRPQRQGSGLESYRRQLEQWLNGAGQ